MISDVDIAQAAHLLPISEVARNLGLAESEYAAYGRDKAKLELTPRPDRPRTKLVLVTAMSPTPYGEGKTTINIGLSMALNRLGKSAISTLREPSLGPVFGRKGGAAGGGYAQVVPMDDINLHFTGDFAAIAAANNLLAALIDNSMYHSNQLRIDPERITHRRTIDMNDRALRRITVSVGTGVERGEHFDIVPASEIMAVLCLASDLADLKRRLANMIVAYTADGEPVTAEQLGAVGAMTLLLKDALKPNLVQTLENTPAIIHGGPFANIAHGCNSIIATRMGLQLADYTITEAGFGADLGAEKFFDIVCPAAGFVPDAAVVVATVRALHYNGAGHAQPLQAGFANLERHVNNLCAYGVPPVVALNRFPTDSDDDVAVVRDMCGRLNVPFAVTDVHAKGSEGGIDLANAVMDACEAGADFSPLYEAELPLTEKIETIARSIYRAGSVELTASAAADLARFEAMGYGRLPVCIAKTQYSFSDDPELVGAPADFPLVIREVRLSAGAEFVVALTRSMMTMPGLPAEPAAAGMDVADDGTITGLS
ncbi:formate--tetrahydrofolate ligase [Trueperella bialowiezensis]|uniref:Formate--tetrahydrofolate ligase n=1 Tax=Trueperella bialowiezensis TaxID=312285 RepID=A0A3S4V040_9ACTO|nr:formate--tetrahydrofolate ligase [Trueperella bialowiezensis]VEI14073.1 Formate--tetrahydrofolate ligase [Trueperella bialowiezensis]